MKYDKNREFFNQLLDTWYAWISFMVLWYVLYSVRVHFRSFQLPLTVILGWVVDIWLGEWGRRWGLMRKRSEWGRRWRTSGSNSYSFPSIVNLNLLLSCLNVQRWLSSTYDVIPFVVFFSRWKTCDVDRYWNCTRTVSKWNVKKYFIGTMGPQMWTLRPEVLEWRLFRTHCLDLSHDLFSFFQSGVRCLLSFQCCLRTGHVCV